MYRSTKDRSYTRRKYMRSVPVSKIILFDMGDLANSQAFQLELSLIAHSNVRATHNALEAARVAANRYLLNKLGEKGYYLKFRIYPHDILRENKQATGAGADRVSDGMRRAFGTPVGLAARIRSGQKIMTARVNLPHYDIAKTALRKGGLKLPVRGTISIDKGKELLKV